MSGSKVVEDGIPYGVYIWEIDGKPVVNEDYDHLQVASKRGDLRKIKAITDFVHNALGIDEGGPVFIEGARPISHTEWEEQKRRQADGEVPDRYDLGNLIDEYNHQKALDAE